MKTDEEIKDSPVWHLAVITKDSVLHFVRAEDKETEIFYRARHGGVFDALCVLVEADTPEQRDHVKQMVADAAETWKLPS